MKHLLLLMLLFFAPFRIDAQSNANDLPQTIVDVAVRGNAKVESDAILTIIKTQKGDVIDRDKIASDVKALYELKYFSNVDVYTTPQGGGVLLTIEVKEKPAIVKIEFDGFNEVTPDDLKDKLETKLYTIVNESTITNDLKIIEKQYAEKGFYLAQASFKLTDKGENEVELTYIMNEGGVVKVADVEIHGNKYFTDNDIISKLASRPYTRSSAYASPGSLYQDEYLKRDLEFIAYYYKDQGFAEVKVAKPVTLLDQDREFVRITFAVEEGLQYSVGKIDVSGDLLFTKEELFEAMKLKPGKLFRISQFQADVDMLVDKYGDLGYAFAFVEPKTKLNRDTNPPTVDINYEITKGDKVYFGDFTIVGNDKTRDNVVRREFEVHESELYHGTRLNQSKKNVERLGFFEEVQAIRSRDEDNQALLHYKIKVKEKPTGQLQAALGFQPNQSKNENKWFGQGRYTEENQSGYGWKTGLGGKWNGGKNYSLDLEFNNPRIYDSHWSLGFDAFLSNQVRDLTDDIEIQERRIGAGVTLGRKIIELIRGSIGYRITKIETTSDAYIIQKLREEGIKSQLILGLSRNSTNNYLDPSEGLISRLNHTFTGGPLLGGDFQYMESTAEQHAYFPIDFSDTYRTYFHLRGVVGHVQPYLGKPVPLLARYRLGGFNDLRGFDTEEIGPHFNLLRSPSGFRSRFNKGGDKQMFYQIEYFAPLIPEAGIKALVFTDLGRVYDDDEAVELDRFHQDFGFGFRWITPIAPFRFEWAYPLIDGKPGDMKFIFTFGI